MIGLFKGEYRFLSNFHPCVVFFGDEVYPTVEHAFQATKTLDSEERVRIRDAAKPGVAKRLGQQVVLREDWEEIKVSVMRYLIEAKFTPESDLAFKLLATGDENLVEGNNWNDHFWGMCGGEGENFLGRLLMARRDELRVAV